MSREPDRAMNEGGKIAFLSLWAVAIAYAFLGLDPVSAKRIVWAAPAAGIVFFAIQLLLPRCTLHAKAPLSPLNWALYCYALQLVGMPLLTTAFGSRLATVPRQPGSASVNLGLVLETLGFVAFAVGVQVLGPRWEARARSRPPTAPGAFPFSRFVAGCIVLGLAGMVVTFGSPRNVLEALTSPLSMLAYAPREGGGLGDAAGLLLRPFLWTGIIAAWGLWLARRPDASPSRRFVVTAAAVLGVVLVAASYSFNRSTLFMPIIAMAAAYSQCISRLSFRSVLLGGGIAIVLALTIGAYRWKDHDMATLLRDANARSQLVEETDVMLQVQMYGQAPQYLGFLLESARQERESFGPGTLLASLLSPVPIVGKPYREATGIARYNRLIYGNVGIADQPIPFVGEIYLATGIAGLLAAFFLLGGAVAGLDAAFLRAVVPFDAYAIQTTAMWLLFLLVVGVLSVSQAFVYFFMPIYGYWLLRPHRS